MTAVVPVTTSTAVATADSLNAFAGGDQFELAQRMAKALSSSGLVPEVYRGNVPNCLIALELANRTGSSIMAVMQNLHIISGRPSWSSSYIIAALNSCGRFSPLRFDIEKLGRRKVQYTTWVGQKGDRKKVTSEIEVDDMRCVAWATDRQGGERLDGPAVTIEMAVREGWYTKSDSKWTTMPDLMIRYRAAAFFGRLYAPDVLMGMQTAEEIADVGAPPIDVQPQPGETSVPAGRSRKLAARVAGATITEADPATVAPPAPAPEPEAVPTDGIEVHEEQSAGIADEGDI